MIQASVVENRSYAHQNNILIVRGPEIVRQVLPGQFVMAAVSEEDGLPTPLLKRALAVYSILYEKDQATGFSLLIRTVGQGTKKLAAARPGDKLDLVGPLGNGFDLKRAEGKVSLIVAGGTGIASVYLLAQRLARLGEEVHLIYGGRSKEDLVGLEDFNRLDIPIVLTTEDGSAGIKGFVTEGLKPSLKRVPRELTNLYTCGPNPMMRAVSKMALEANVPCQISVEMKMACGFGVCLGCTVKSTEGHRLACTHGPVFDSETFVWESERQG